jgi:thiol-disulfide isomerase/thioredoxin
MKTAATIIIFCLAFLSACHAAESVTVQVLDFDGLQKLIAGHKGKVVVMDCWSTSCAPCIQEFPNLVALHKKYGPAQVACISLSFDYDGSDKLADVQPPVQKFLDRQGATFDNVLSSTPSDELCKKLDLASIPAVYVFDRNGNLAKRFEGSKAYDDVPALVEKLVGGKQ